MTKITTKEIQQEALQFLYDNYDLYLYQKKNKEQVVSKEEVKKVIGLVLKNFHFHFDLHYQDNPTSFYTNNELFVTVTAKTKTEAKKEIKRLLSEDFDLAYLADWEKMRILQQLDTFLINSWKAETTLEGHVSWHYQEN